MYGSANNPECCAELLETSNLYLRLYEFRTVLKDIVHEAMFPVT